MLFRSEIAPQITEIYNHKQLQPIEKVRNIANLIKDRSSSTMSSQVILTNLCKILGKYVKRA